MSSSTICSLSCITIEHKPLPSKKLIDIAKAFTRSSTFDLVEFLFPICLQQVMSSMILMLLLKVLYGQAVTLYRSGRRPALRYCTV